MTELRKMIEALFAPALDPKAPYAVQLFNELETLINVERPRGYNVLTDEEVTFPSPVPGVAGGPQLRMRAIEAAVDAVKAGAAFDVLKGAERYIAFALGREIPKADDPRPFRRRLFDLLEEEVHAERTDLEKLRHDVSEVFGQVEDAHWPSVEEITSDLIKAGMPAERVYQGGAGGSAEGMTVTIPGDALGVSGGVGGNSGGR